jgi:hypothetical protein
MSSAAEVPSALKKKKNRKAYEEDYKAPNPVAEGFPRVSNVFKSKSYVKSLSSPVRPDAEVVPRFNSDGFRAQVPSQKALAIFSQKLSAVNFTKPSIQKASSVASLSQNHEICTKQTPSQQKIPSQKKQSSKKKWFDDEPQIQDAVFKDYSNEYESRKKSGQPETKKAPEIKLGIAKKDAGMNRNRINYAEVDEEPQKTEPGAISTITKSKEQIKQSLKKRPSKNITALDAFDYVVDTFKGKTGSGKSVEERPLSVQKKVKKHSLKSNIKRGIRALGEIADEFEKTPIARNWKANAEVEYAHMRSGARRARGSIIACGSNKRSLSTGSLITQRGLVTKTTTNATYDNANDSSNPYTITARYERGISGRIELHFYYMGQRVTHEKVARILTQKQIQILKQEAKNAIIGQPAPVKETSTTTEQSNSGNNKGTIVAKAAKSVSRSTIHKQKIATVSGLVRRHRAGVM